MGFFRGYRSANMLMTDGLQVFVGFKTVGSDCLGGSDSLPDRWFDKFTFDRINGLHGNESRVFSLGFNHHQHRCFVRCPPASAAFSRTAKKCVVQFNESG